MKISKAEGTAVLNCERCSEKFEATAHRTSYALLIKPNSSFRFYRSHRACRCVQLVEGRSRRSSAKSRTEETLRFSVTTSIWLRQRWRWWQRRRRLTKSPYIPSFTRLTIFAHSCTINHRCYLLYYCVLMHVFPEQERLASLRVILGLGSVVAAARSVVNVASRLSTANDVCGTQEFVLAPQRLEVL